jgi:hypothetical protein
VGSEVELRLSTLPTAFGEKLVMRIFDPEVLQQEFRGSGPGRRGPRALASDDRHGQRHRAGHRAHGLGQDHHAVLHPAPAGHPEVNVCTIEDPIEMVEGAFNQMQVNHAIDLDFSTGVRTLMRQDPDIIMVGEIRDLETAHMAIQAALTGHLVLSTLHTNDSPSSVSRLLELGAPAYLIKATLRGIMSSAWCAFSARLQARDRPATPSTAGRSWCSPSHPHARAESTRPWAARCAAIPVTGAPRYLRGAGQFAGGAGRDHHPHQYRAPA